MKSFGYTLKQSFIQFKRNLNMEIISMFAIVCMLLILGVACLILVNINSATETIKGEYDSIELFLLDDTTQEQADEIIADAKTQPGVSDAFYKSKEDAMAEFKDRWGDNGYLLDSLKDNPLPNSVVIKINDLEKADALAAHAESYSGVEDIKYDKCTVDKLLKLTRLIQIGAIIIMAFLLIVCIIVVANTIKLTVFNRAEEISIMKYVGATNWFIRGPFLGEGILIGFISSVIALGVTWLVYAKIVEVVGEQLDKMLSMPMVQVDAMMMNFAIVFPVLGILIGALGSIISMRRFLDA